MNKSILIVDDDKDITDVLTTRLRKQGYSVSAAADGESAVEWVHIHAPALVLLDVRLPGISGTEVLRSILNVRPETYVVMISAQSDIKIAVECIKIGAYDFFEKPCDFSVFDSKVKQVFHQIFPEETNGVKRDLGAAYKYKSLVGSGKAMKRVFEAIDIAAKSDTNVLIQGESGTGKELVARAIHAQSAQKDKPFVALNCAAIPENLLESELFGHEKGAFTGAAARKIGKFEQANGGTIFLDEIGDLPLSLQVKLLRVFQEREIERVGGLQAIPIQVRLLTATHRDLKKIVSEGQFREDLYYRINVFPILVPPLRDRKEDIPELFNYFVNERRKGQPVVEIDEQTMLKLTEYNWPGNIRELENFVERMLLHMGNRKHITIKDIQGLDSAGPRSEENGSSETASDDRMDLLKETEKGILEKALADAGGNVTKASELVRMSRDSFYRKIKKYGITR